MSDDSIKKPNFSIPFDDPRWTPEISNEYSSDIRISGGTAIPVFYNTTGQILTTGQVIEQIKDIIDEKDESEDQVWSDLRNSYIDFISWAFKYDKRAREHILISAKIITFLVPFIVIVGLVFSGLQLYNALSTGDIQSLNTDLAIETAGKISINSSIVGGVVLVISIVFFYLYLRFAYEKPIINIYRQKISPPENINNNE